MKIYTKPNGSKSDEKSIVYIETCCQKILKRDVRFMDVRAQLSSFNKIYRLFVNNSPVDFCPDCGAEIKQLDVQDFTNELIEKASPDFVKEVDEIKKDYARLLGKDLDNQKFEIRYNNLKEEYHHLLDKLKNKLIKTLDESRKDWS